MLPKTVHGNVCFKSEPAEYSCFCDGVFFIRGHVNRLFDCNGPVNLSDPKIGRSSFFTAKKIKLVEKSVGLVLVNESDVTYK